MLLTSGDAAVSTPVFSGHRLLIGGLMLKLDADKAAVSVLWPETRAVSKRVLSNTSTALLRGEYVFSAKTSGELVCLEAGTGKEVWATNTVTSLRNGSSIHLTPNADAVFLFTDKGDLIRAELTPQGYREISRAHLLKPTSPFGDRKCAWTPPAYANRHVFARNDEELVCASLAAGP
jgi:outer membrane protein assembly factor BamB